jgi:hypothetical protein
VVDTVVAEAAAEATVEVVLRVDRLGVALRIRAAVAVALVADTLEEAAVVATAAVGATVAVAVAVGATAVAATAEEAVVVEAVATPASFARGVVRLVTTHANVRIANGWTSLVHTHTYPIVELSRRYDSS